MLPARRSRRRMEPGIIAPIPPLNETAMTMARARQDMLTKPRGSLGRLESLSIQLAGISGQALPQIEHKVIITMAGDHGVVAEGVSAYPQEVTPQMVLNFLGGGAAINVLARHVGARVIVVDMGVVADMAPRAGLVCEKCRLLYEIIDDIPVMLIDKAKKLDSGERQG